MEISIQDLAQAIKQVGAERHLDWLDESLAKNLFFYSVTLETVARQTHPVDLVSTIKAILVATEYLYDKSGVNSRNCLLSRPGWSGIVNVDIGQEKVTKLAAHGYQKNVPQRAAVIIDFLAHNKLLTPGQNNIIELGCGGGAMGIIFDKFQELDWNRYTTLHRLPECPQEYYFNYQGIDRHITEKHFSPFFIYDEKLRRKSQLLLQDYNLSGSLSERSLDDFLEKDLVVEVPTFLVTSYILLQLNNAVEIYEKLIDKVANTPNLHWIDLSMKTEDLKFLFGENLQGRDFFQDGMHYLSHNGIPRCDSVFATDVWNEWRYLK